MDNALAALFLQAFNGSIPTKHEIHKQLDTVREFNRLQPKKLRKGVMGPAYEARLAVTNTLAGILDGYRVIQPVTIYRMKIERLQIEGEYAILESKYRLPGPFGFRFPGPFVFQLRSTDISAIQSVAGFEDRWPLNVVSHLRLAHLLRELDLPEGRLISLHVPSGKLHTACVLRSGILRAADSAVRTYLAQAAFPTPGAHCQSCPSTACFADVVAKGIAA